MEKEKSHEKRSNKKNLECPTPDSNPEECWTRDLTNEQLGYVVPLQFVFILITQNYKNNICWTFNTFKAIIWPDINLWNI